MDIVVERCAGLDVHKDSVVACVRVPGPSGERETKVGDVRHLHRGSARLARLGSVIARDNPGGHGGHRRLLEAGPLPARRGARLLALERPPHAQRPGTQDRRGLTPSGSVSSPSTASCVEPASSSPPADPRDQRADLAIDARVVEERAREAQRLDKVLQDAGVKLSSVASDIFGAVSGRIHARRRSVSGTEDPAALAELAKRAAAQEAAPARVRPSRAVSGRTPSRSWWPRSSGQLDYSRRGDRPTLRRDRRAHRPFR